MNKGNGFSYRSSNSIPVEIFSDSGGDDIVIFDAAEVSNQPNSGIIFTDGQILGSGEQEPPILETGEQKQLK